MPRPIALTFQRHKARWLECTACDLCESRKHVVLLRGTVPAKVLFVGEAPGESEDVLGKPFVGPAGKLLDCIIESAGLAAGDYALTNLIACIPRDEQLNKVHAPPEYAVEACSKRLEECVRLVNPSLIVRVGGEADRYLKHYDYPQLSIIHPAAILRMHVSQRSLAYQRCVVTIADAWSEL